MKKKIFRVKSCETANSSCLKIRTFVVVSGRRERNKTLDKVQECLKKTQNKIKKTKKGKKEVLEGQKHKDNKNCLNLCLHDWVNDNLFFFFIFNATLL